MTLTELVTAAVSERGRARVEDLQPVFPDCTREQITQALFNARANGRLIVVDRGKALGKGRGRTTSVYAIPPGPMRVPSVFCLAAPPVPISEARGTVHRPLGSWESPP